MPGLIFKLVFLSQIVMLSYAIPRKVAKRTGRGESRYLMLNNVVAAAGILGLILFSLHPAFESVTSLLLGVGVFFILQIVPLGAVVEHMGGSASPSPQNSFSLFAAVRPVVAGTAGVLFLTYLVFAVITWDKAINTGLLQIAIFLGTNVFLVVMLRMSIRGMENAESGEERNLRSRNLYRIAPLFAYTSIVISIYYLCKEVLFGLELEPYRPVMMSAFMQLIAVLAVSQLSHARGPYRVG